MEITTLMGLAKAQQERVNAISNRELDSVHEGSEEDLLDGKITAAFEADKRFVELTGFSREMITHWVDLLGPYSMNARKRGPMPKSFLSDALMCYLVYLHILYDNTTVESFRPKGRFGEVKHYFDGHHKVYGLKVEIAVTSARPHVCIATTPHQPGSVSDYTIHCGNCAQYLDYLHKTTNERQASEQRDPNPY